jgi:hypothetical protein
MCGRGLGRTLLSMNTRPHPHQMPHTAAHCVRSRPLIPRALRSHAALAVATSAMAAAILPPRRGPPRARPSACTSRATRAYPLRARARRAPVRHGGTPATTPRPARAAMAPRTDTLTEARCVWSDIRRPRDDDQGPPAVHLGPMPSGRGGATHTARHHAVVIASLHGRVGSGHPQTFTLTLDRAGRALAAQPHRTRTAVQHGGLE